MSKSATSPIKTSLTHPLSLPAVATPGGGGIGMAMCPGKQQLEAITGPWDRDLKVDLAAITRFGARSLITLMEAAELTAARVPTDVLQSAAQTAELTWYHWPIVDFAAPDADFERLWQSEAAIICRQLLAGGKIVVHCRGGRGRSGLVAARLLIELGINPDDAIASVRAVQPMAMETTAQEAHVRAYRPRLTGLKYP